LVASVWDDIADSPEEAENLRIRAALIRAIRSRVDEIGWSQTAAAHNLGLTQPRLSDLCRGKISKFSLDALVDVASKLGIHVRIEIDENFALPA
jgi:predicted XRE-type DNA-binding protein